MKNIKTCLLLILGVAGLYSCTSDDNAPQVGTRVSPGFTNTDLAETYVLTSAMADSTFEVFTWSDAKWGDVSLPVIYTMQMALAETDFATPVTVATSNLPTLTLTQSEVNDAVLSLGITSATATNVEIRLVASPINENSEVITSLDTLCSESLSMTITPYLADKVIAPLFLVGSVLGSYSWDASNYRYLLFKDDSETSNTVFTCTTNFKAGEYKLLVTLSVWSTAWGYDSSGQIVQMDNGGNLSATAGYKTMTFDTSTGTLTYASYDTSAVVSYASIGLCGAFNSWGTTSDILLTKTDYDSHIWVADGVVLSAGALKFRANSAWTSNWGSTNFPYGIASSGGSNMTVNTAGTYFVKFNDITGHYVFYKLE
jgi:starch-binding outer membrane protein SusE/F